jgi:hypothetical protein
MDETKNNKDEIPEGHKRCSGCKEVKSLDKFDRDKSTKDGFRGRCKKCRDKCRRENKKKEPKEKIPEGYKRCYSFCGLIKHLDEFGKNKGRPDGYQNECKICRCEKQIEYAKNHKNEKRIYDKERRRKAREEETDEDKEKRKAKQRIYYDENREIILQNDRKYRQKNKGKITEEDRQRKNEYNKQYSANHKKEIRAQRKKRWKENPQLKIASNLRRRLREVLKGKRKVGSAIKDIGCSKEELIQYFESQFYSHPQTNEMMSWENYGKYGWHIDHIIPLSSFDLEDREEFLKVCRYTNLQPLWAEENLRKGDLILTSEQMENLKLGIKKNLINIRKSV